MEPLTTGHDAVSRAESSVHDWRVSQLTRLGIARLVCRGCPPRLALRIVC